jgi:hypothetical protein
MSAAKTGEAGMEVDEHLTKFPPLKGPRIGGNFHVDENVVAGTAAPRRWVRGTNLLLTTT